MTIQEAIKLLEEMKENCKAMPFEYRDEKATLKAEAIDTVIKALAELKESKKEKWKPKATEEYWFRSDDTGEIENVFRYEGDDWDDYRVNNVPIFKTREECEKYWHFMDTVKEKSYEFSKEEWEDGDIIKNFIYYDSLYDKWTVDFEDICKSFGTVYFKTKEDAQYIIDNFKEELMEYWL